MSRIGRMPVAIPQGVEVKTEGSSVRVKGPKGELSSQVPFGLTVTIQDQEVRIARANDEPQQRASHGLLRSLVANSVQGVTKGFSKDLEIVGVGYKAEVRGKAIVFTLGYSHPIHFSIPEGIQIALDAKAGGAIQYPVRDFYLTNAICRASPTMRRCSEELLHGQSFAEAAE